MAEITETKAANLSADDTRCLLNFRDHTHETIVYGLTIQQLLDLYHASNEYISIEDWLGDDPDAQKVYAKITGQTLEQAAAA